MNLSSVFIYRQSFLIGFVMELLWFIMFILFYRVLFSHVPSLEGFSYFEVLLYFALFNMLESLFSFFFARSLYMMVQDVRTGQYDYLITKPIDLQFFSSLRFVQVQSLFQVLAGLVLFVYAYLNIGVDWLNVLTFVVYLGIMFMFLYAVVIVFMSTIFWLYGFNEYTTAMNFLFRMVMYPPQIYSGAMFFLIYYLIPLGLIVSTPIQALIRGLSFSGHTLGMLALGIFLVLGARRIFYLALKHYSSASS